MYLQNIENKAFHTNHKRNTALSVSYPFSLKKLIIDERWYRWDLNRRLYYPRPEWNNTYVKFEKTPEIIWNSNGIVRPKTITVNTLTLKCFLKTIGLGGDDESTFFLLVLRPYYAGRVKKLLEKIQKRSLFRHDCVPF